MQSESINPTSSLSQQTISKPFQLKLKSETPFNNSSPIPSSMITPMTILNKAVNGDGPSTKRTQKAKPRNTDYIKSANIIPANSIDEIIGDMHFQEPPKQPDVTQVKQDQILQKQKELLEQLQQGIRPGWFIQCVAKRADGKQCTRNIKKGSEFCMGHSNKCVYGKFAYQPLSITDTNTEAGQMTTTTLITNGQNITDITHSYNHAKVARKKSTNRQLKNIRDSTPGVDAMEETETESEDEDASNIPDDVKELLSTYAANTESLKNTPAFRTGIKSSNSKPSARTSVRPTITNPISVANISSGVVPEANSSDIQPPAAPKKRGRRRKLPIDSRFGNNDYIIMWPIICEDQRYLIDRYENIYSNEPARPAFIGIREVNGKINRTALPKTC